ncbi:MAG: hypothetical protein AB9836_11255 [Aminipila sp.]
MRPRAFILHQNHIYNVIQGTANTVLAIAGSDAIAPNPLQEVTKYVGYKIAGDKGAAVAGKMYGVADFTLGCVSGGGALKYFSKVDKVGDLAKQQYMRCWLNSII